MLPSFNTYKIINTANKNKLKIAKTVTPGLGACNNAKSNDDLAKARKIATENYLMKMLGRSNSFYLILKDIAGKAPKKFQSFFELLTTPEDE